MLRRDELPLLPPIWGGRDIPLSEPTTSSTVCWLGSRPHGWRLAPLIGRQQHSLGVLLHPNFVLTGTRWFLICGATSVTRRIVHIRPRNHDPRFSER
jgi:hypothetical protein